ncbi:MAG: hypothetical protein HFJ55_01275 [Clostridia bacterium]|nr:hypothetical protein [Clostridia bacterium]
MVGIILDIILILIILANVYICYKKGLIKLAVGLIAVVASIILAVILYKPISNVIINNTEIDNKIENAIIENFTQKGENTTQESQDNGFMNYIEKYVDDTVNKTKNEIVIEAAGVIATKVINVAVMIGIFVISRLILIVLTFLTDMIAELPILKQFNELGGLIYGIIKAILIIYLILAIMFFIIYVTGNTALSDAISSTFITKIFYNNNLLLTILF